MHTRENTDFWTAERVGQLREHVKAGAGYSAIATAMSITRNQALGKAKRLRDAGDPDFAIRDPSKIMKLPRDRMPAALPPKKSALKIVKAGPVLRSRPLPLFDSYHVADRAGLAIEPPKNVALLDLPARACKWPTGRLDGQHLFCGNPADGVYCAGHARMSYTGAPRPNVRVAEGPRIDSVDRLAEAV